MSNSKINKKCIAKNKGQTVDGIAYEICGCMGLSRTKGHIRSETFWQDTISFSCESHTTGFSHRPIWCSNSRLDNQYPDRFVSEDL